MKSLPKFMFCVLVRVWRSANLFRCLGEARKAKYESASPTFCIPAPLMHLALFLLLQVYHQRNQIPLLLGLDKGNKNQTKREKGYDRSRVVHNLGLVNNSFCKLACCTMLAGKLYGTRLNHCRLQWFKYVKQSNDRQTKCRYCHAWPGMLGSLSLFSHLHRCCNVRRN